MNYTFTDILGYEEEYTSLNELKKVLSKPTEYWLEGTGETAIQVKENELLIFFKIEKGVFIMQHPDYLSPKVNHEELEVYEHNIGGEDMSIPSTCICDVSTAFEILSSYIKNKERSGDFSWVDFYEECER